jgi:hypothetical protein
MAFEIKLVKQRLLHHRPFAHHRQVPPVPKRTESGLRDPSNSDFFNEIRR